MPSVRSEAGKGCRFYYGPWSWTSLQAALKLETLVSLHDFKVRIMEVVTAILSSCCY